MESNRRYQPTSPGRDQLQLLEEFPRRTHWEGEPLDELLLLLTVQAPENRSADLKPDLVQLVGSPRDPLLLDIRV
jgi:hypothetical protein